MIRDIRSFLKQEEGAGRLADVTARLGGDTVEIDPQGWMEDGVLMGRRSPGESKTVLLHVSAVKDCLPKLLDGDTLLFFLHSGRLAHSGTARLCPDGKFRLEHGEKASLTGCTLAQYCSRWSTIAGIKVLRDIRDRYPYTYTKREVMMPMRDGVKLYAAVYEPHTDEPRPVMLLRTPYPAGHYGGGGVGDLSERTAAFLSHGYIMVEQNVRGTYMSEGDFVNVRPVGYGKTDEVTDAYDTIEWIVSNTRCNGNVGIYGVSYPGFYATLAALCGHPALKAVSPQAPVTDWWMGDDAHRNGAFMLADMYGFGSFFFLPKLNPTPDSRVPETEGPGEEDIYSFFKGKGTACLLEPFGSDSFFSEIKAHPDYDAFWRRRNPLQHIRDVKPAVMVVGGLYDAEDSWGALYTYKALREQSPETESYFVCGPWTHGGWKKVPEYLEGIEYPFFAYYLEGRGVKPSSSEIIFPTGLQEADSVAPAGMISGVPQAEERRFSLRPGSFVSDPKDPVPYMGSLSPRRDKSYMWADQGFAAGRRDVYQHILFEAAADTLLAGPVEVHLKASCTGTDADFVVKLVDRAPDGSSSLVRADVMPARWRNSVRKAEPLPAGKSVSVFFTLNPICHVLKQGHSLAVQVQGSWFPLIPANPQVFLKNPYTDEPPQCRKAVMRIFRGSWISFGIKC